MKDQIRKMCLRNTLLFSFVFVLVLLLLLLPLVDAHYGPKINSILDKPESRRDVTDALYQIAQVLQNNHQHTTLHERIAVLETKLALSIEKNSLLENRIAVIEKQLPHINDQLVTSEKILLNAKTLEGQTNTLMEEFEQKLSALAGEILRLKSIATKSKSVLPQKKYVLGIKEDIEKLEWIDTCFPAAFFSNSTKNESVCLLTPKNKVANWTIANHICRMNGGLLASSVDMRGSNILTGMNTTIWISDELQEKTNYIQGETKSPLKHANIYDQDNSAEINIFSSGDDESILSIADTKSHNSKENENDNENSVSSSAENEKEKMENLLELTPDNDNALDNKNDQNDLTTAGTSESDSLNLFNPPSNSVLYKEFMLLEPDNEEGRNSTSMTNIATKTVSNEYFCSIFICSNTTSCTVEKRICSDFYTFWCVNAVPISM